MNIRFLPFDASQTTYCDRTIKSSRCHEMPIWEFEVDENNSYDKDYPDKDDYHEYYDEFDGVPKPKFWSEQSEKYSSLYFQDSDNCIKEIFFRRAVKTTLRIHFKSR